jgi:hypothetical protein
MVESWEPPIGQTTALNSQPKTLNCFISQKPEYLPVSTSFEPNLERRSMTADLLQAGGSKKLLREKEE